MDLLEAQAVWVALKVIGLILPPLMTYSAIKQRSFPILLLAICFGVFAPFVAYPIMFIIAVIVKPDKDTGADSSLISQEPTDDQAKLTRVESVSTDEESPQ